MPNTHAVCNTMHCACWDVDSYNRVGIYAQDADNGMMFTCGNVAKTGNKVTGYQFTVSLPAANATGLWMARTPIPGTSSMLETQVYGDPRYFYNEAGKPISLKYLVPTDVVEVTAPAFSTGNAPTDHATYTYVTVGTDGKLAVVESAPAQGTYFRILGEGVIDCGQDLPVSYILECVRN